MKKAIARILSNFETVGISHVVLLYENFNSNVVR